VLGTPYTVALLVLPSSLQVQGPSGLVLVEGGETKIGSTVEEIEKILEDHQGLPADTLAGETPRHTEHVDDFWLMPTEVTNEQYAAYVRAARAQPPYSWGEEALDEGRRAFLEAEGKRIREARAKGETVVRKRFAPGEWWDENWRDCQWAVPDDEATHPVVYVSHADARGYAAWAGLRLMTELEFTRAARRDTDHIWPWGNEWDDEKCNALHGDGSTPVASFPDGAVGGIYDLAGNVWEWTSSPYRSFPGYERLTIRIGRGRQVLWIEADARFDPDKRVLVSGATSKLSVRIATRQPSRRDQRTEAIGFRCAADVVPGKTAAARILDEDIDFGVLPPDTEFSTGAVVATQRWTSRVGSVHIDGYAVIAGYEHMLFCPVRSIPVANEIELARASEDEPVPLGFVSLTHPLVEPAIDGGTYLVAWRAAKPIDATPNRAGLGQTKTSFWEVDGFDADSDCFFLYAVDGQPIVAFPAGEPGFGRMRAGSVTLDRFVPPTAKELAERAKRMELAAKGEAESPPPIVPADTLTFSIMVAGKSRSKGILFDLPLKVAVGTVDETWPGATESLGR